MGYHWPKATSYLTLAALGYDGSLIIDGAYRFAPIDSYGSSIFWLTFIASYLSCKIVLKVSLATCMMREEAI